MLLPHVRRNAPILSHRCPQQIRTLVDIISLGTEVNVCVRNEKLTFATRHPRYRLHIPTPVDCPFAHTILNTHTAKGQYGFKLTGVQSNIPPSKS